MKGSLAMRFERDADSGRTLLHLERQQPPWRVVRSFPVSSGEALVHVHNVSGGILGRDDLALEVEVGRGARAQITSTGATRVYRRGAGSGARLTINVRIEEDGLLEYLPDPLIPYAGASLEQNTAVELRPGATLFWWDVLAPGREASGEVFRYDALRLSLQLTAGGRRILSDRWRLEPHQRPLHSPARLGDFRHLAAFYICQAGRTAGDWLALEDELGSLADELTRGPEVLWGVSVLPASGLAVRGVSTKGRDLLQGLPLFWAKAKWSLCGRAAVFPRKIH